MFIAFRDLRYATGRFALVGSVITLMSLLVVLLSGLTAGLSAASVSAVSALPVGSVTFEQPADGSEIDFATSSLPVDTVARARALPEVTSVHPLGISTGRVTKDGRTSAATFIGTDTALLPEFRSGTAPGPGEVAPTAGLAAELGVTTGDRLTVGALALTVSGVTLDTSFSHLPVLYTGIADWQQLAHTSTITALGVDTSDRAAVDQALGTRTTSREDAFAGVGGYTSEQNSLDAMRWLLIGISALVVGSFFTVWTIQRRHDLAVVRAIGGTPGYLLRDALGQAAIVLLVGAALGAVAAIGLGALADGVVPFALTVGAVAQPLLIMFGLGLVGAAVAVRTVATVDPLTALGAS